eukprot:gene11435-2080_t
MLAVVATGAISVPGRLGNYTVLNNTDFYGYNVGGVKAATFADCAAQCEANPGCSACSWNGPQSKIHDSNCNLHCSTKGKTEDQGELGPFQAGAIPSAACVWTRSLGHPAACWQDLLLPIVPHPALPSAEWVAREAQANMYIARQQPMVIGNGYIASMTHSGVMYAAGVFNGNLDLNKGEPVRATIPSFWDGYTLQGYKCNPHLQHPTLTGSCGDYAAAIDTGVSAVYSLGAFPPGASVLTRKYAHRKMPHLIVIEWTFDNSNGSTPLISSISQPQAWGSSAETLQTKDTAWSYNASASPPGAACWQGQVMVSEDPSFPLIHLGLCSTDLRTSPLAVNVPTGQQHTETLIATVYTTLDGPYRHGSPVEAAATDFRSASAMAPGDLWQAHTAAVSDALMSGIEVNASFHMLVASLRPEQEYWYSSSPGGLATDCYNGHTFWDMETWMYPNLLFFHPDLATGTVNYRAGALGWAQRWAQQTGRVGARYPWQTAGAGKAASRANLNEIHIVGDVALSMWQYYAATANMTWLQSHGLPVLEGTAQFFAAWATQNPDGSFSLKGTQGPDEFHSGDDSCYVNAAAALNLRSAANFSAMLGRQVPSNWTEIAAKVRMPFDETRQMHLEYAQWQDSMKCKQADTIMLSYPLGVEMSSNVRANDLEYYALHTGNGPSMTWGMYLVGYLEIGELDKAATFFNKSWIPYVDNAAGFHCNGIRTTGNFGGDCGGNFLTGAGGFLQGLWAGWAGMRLRLNSLDFISPRMPVTTTGVKLR